MFTINKNDIGWLLKAAAKDTYRPALCGVLFTSNAGGRAVATDTHRMHVCIAVADEEGMEDTIVPSESLKIAVKYLTGKNTVIRVYRDRLEAMKGESEDVLGTVPYTPVASTYPNWERVCPDGGGLKSAIHTLAVNGTFLGDVCGWGGEDSANRVRLYQAKPGRPLVVFPGEPKSLGHYVQSEPRFGVIMPMAW